MEESNISEKAFAQIKEEGIEPSSEMKFHFQRSLFWLSAFLALVVGALAVAVTLYVIADNDWDILGERGGGLAKLNFTQVVLYSLPYFWIMLLGGFLLIAHYTFRHTKFGYRYRLWQVVLANILLAIILGTLFYLCGFGAKLDYVLAKNMPMYNQMNNQRIKFWSQPQTGFLAGEIIQPGLEFIILEDMQDRQWRVNIIQAKVKPRVNFLDGERIKVLGKIENEVDFLAEEVRPWFGHQFFLGPKIEMKEKVNR